MIISATDAPLISPPVLPTERTKGLGELIYAYRTYMGLSQRNMARRLEFDRRDYQRIEQGRNDCPVGFLSKVIALADLYDNVVDALIDKATTVGGLTVLCDPDLEWERSVSGRAAVLAASRENPPRIDLTSKASPLDIRSPR